MLKVKAQQKYADKDAESGETQTWPYPQYGKPEIDYCSGTKTRDGWCKAVQSRIRIARSRQHGPQGSGMMAMWPLQISSRRHRRAFAPIRRATVRSKSKLVPYSLHVDNSGTRNEMQPESFVLLPVSNTVQHCPQPEQLECMRGLQSWRAMVGAWEAQLRRGHHSRGLTGPSSAEEMLCC